MTWSDIRFIAVALVLFFLFVGEPDVWDRLHERVMAKPLNECSSPSS